MSNQVRTQPPEVGNLVRLRGGMWVVTDVHGAFDQPHHLVDVVSVDGPETMTVAWQVEPGRRVHERVELPEPTVGGFDTPRTLDAFLDAVRWGAITSAERGVLQSPFRSGIRIEDYQLVPLVKALSQPRANLLISDDTGLGKTVEAGLIVHEFVLRNRVRTCFVVCPSSLTRKWQAEMAEKFGLNFVILDTAELGRIRRTFGRHLNPLTAHPYVICSIDWLKRPEQEPLLDQVLPVDTHVYPRRFDALVVDEAHHVAPSGDGPLAIDSQRTRLVQRIAPHFEHKLFLTATPHNGKPESFQALLSLLDSRQFARGVPPTPAQLDRVMVRRLKSHITTILGDDAPFARRELHPIEQTFTEGEHATYRLLLDYDQSRREAAGGDGKLESAAGFVTLLLKKRFLSSPRAFADTLEKHIDTALAGSRDRTVRTLRELYEASLENHEDDDEVDQTEQDMLAASLGTGTELTPGQAEQLDRMRGWAIKNRNVASSKAKQAIEWVRSVCLDDDGDFNEKRVVIFTEYRSTLDWFRDLLVKDGLTAGKHAQRIEIIHGGVDDDERARINGDFNYDPSQRPVRILLCTDAASEGIDLHLECHRLLHLDIPFSPTKMEQRNGRIDRHGQTSPTADVFYFTAANDPGPAGDTYFLNLIVTKTEEIRNDLGDVNALLADLHDTTTLAELQNDIEQGLQGRPITIAGRRPSAGGADVLALTRELEAGIVEARKALRDTADDLELQADEVAHVVNTALTLDHQPTLRPDSGDGVWEVPSGLSRDWQEALTSLWDPRSQQQRPVTFDAHTAEAAPGPVYLHLAHPLVARATELLRAQVWTRTATQQALNRVTARYYDADLLPDGHYAAGAVCAFAHARVVITGGDGAPLHESVVRTGGRHAGQWARFRTLTEADEVWATRTDDPVPAEVTDRLVGLWPSINESLFTGLTARGNDVGESMSRRLDERRRDDERRFDAMIDELTRRVQSRLDEIKTTDSPQPELEGFDQAWVDEQRLQRELNIKILQQQVNELNDVADAEKDAIAKRYETREPRVFPMTVTFLVPRPKDA